MSKHVLDAVESLRRAREEYRNLLRDKENNHGAKPADIRRRIAIIDRVQRALGNLY